MEKDNRFFIFGMSLIFLLFSIGLIFFLIALRSSPDHLEEEPLHPFELSVTPVHQQAHPIKVLLYGTAEPEKVITLQSSVSGKILETIDLYAGKEVFPGELLFNIEKTKIDLSIRQLVLKREELGLQSLQLTKQVEVLQSRVESAQLLLEVSKEAVDKYLSNLEIEKKLFSKSEQLFESKHISDAEHLNAKHSYQQSELALLGGREQVERNRDALHRLDLELSSTEIALKQLENEREQLALQIKNLQEDRWKSDVMVDTPSQITEVLAEKGQEVTPGTPLAKVRVSDSVEIVVNIPDSYFQWLYAGKMLSPKDHTDPYNNLTLRLVNKDFPRTFPGGFVKSIGESVNIPTRSLPIVIGRNNPKTPSGKVISHEELKPGMYCEVELELHRVKNSFLIPREALQKENRLYHVLLDEEDRKILDITDPVEIIFESEAGIIVTLPHSFRHLLLVSHELKAALPGHPVEILNQEIR